MTGPYGSLSWAPSRGGVVRALKSSKSGQATMHEAIIKSLLVLFLNLLFFLLCNNFYFSIGIDVQNCISFKCTTQ